MAAGPERYGFEDNIDERVRMLSVDFIANIPQLEELPLEARIYAVNRVTILISEVEKILNGEEEGSSHVSCFGYILNNEKMAIADCGMIVNGEIVHDVRLWNKEDILKNLNIRESFMPRRD